ncbi:MAG: DUF3047 domain-containing protein [Burkholderiaceae bacterium]|nr:DUF3047 domain-containing protein [Burkholderiaceae bacterium]
MRLIAAVASAAALAGCATPAPAPSPHEVAAFSANRAGATAPRGWQPLVITRAKAPTQYRLVYDERAGAVVVQARAERSATGLKQPLDVDSAARPRVAWRWRVPGLIAGADNLDRHAEDSPVRLLLFFDGDKRRLPARDQQALELAEMVSGQSVPYATLVYMWENRQPVGTLIDSAHTGRVKMIVAGSGADRLGPADRRRHHDRHRQHRRRGRGFLRRRRTARRLLRCRLCHRRDNRRRLPKPEAGARGRRPR